jgi:acyl-CoA thioester hydrolase
LTVHRHFLGEQAKDYNIPVANSRDDPVFHYTFTIPPEAIDENGHVNNVRYVQWMQDIAVRHYDFLGGIPPMRALGATWVVRSHRIEYLNPAFEGDVIEARTWVVNILRVRSLRRYEFVRNGDGVLLAKGETEWVFVDTETGRPLAIPNTVAGLFHLLPDGKDHS